MLHKILRTVLMLIPAVGFTAGTPASEIVWQGALPLPMTADAAIPDRLPAASESAPLPEPPLPPAPPARSALPVVTGALVDLPDASASFDNPFGLGAGLRHYFNRREATPIPYIGLDAGVRRLADDQALADSPFSAPIWQPNIGLRAGVTYPVSAGFTLGLASGLYYQSGRLAPEQPFGQGAATPYDRGGEGLLVPLSVRGLMRF